MYIFDTGVFIVLGHWYPSSFPTFWRKLDRLANKGKIHSVKEVRNELEYGSPVKHVDEWAKKHRNIFKKPNEDEFKVVLELMQTEKHRDLVRKKNILNGRPVADPFVIAAAKVHGRCIITQEKYRPHGARIPTICEELGIECANLEGFMKREGL